MGCCWYLIFGQTYTVEVQTGASHTEVWPKFWFAYLSPIRASVEKCFKLLLKRQKKAGPNQNSNTNLVGCMEFKQNYQVVPLN